MSALERRRRPVPPELFGGRLSGCFVLDLEVVGARDHTTRYRTITFQSPDLVDFEWQPGQDLMFDVPGETGIRRRYSIRRSDARAGTLDVDVVLHEHGRFARWATSAAPGDCVDAIGPRGSTAVRSDATTHLFVADESAIGVTYAMLEVVPAGCQATALIACEGQLPIEPPPCPAQLEVVSLTAAEVPDRLREWKLSEGTVASINGERGLVRSTVDVLIGRGLPRDAVSAKP